MAYQKPNDIDTFVVHMGKADMRVKALLAEDLVQYLSDSENSIESADLGLLIDALMPWLTGSHFKVSYFLCYVIESVESSFFYCFLLLLITFAPFHRLGTHFFS